MHKLSYAGPSTWSEWALDEIVKRARRGELSRVNIGDQGGPVLVYWAASFERHGVVYTLSGYCRARSTRAFERELERRGYDEPTTTTNPMNLCACFGSSR